jgi:hypothetical protein
MPVQQARQLWIFPDAGFYDLVHVGALAGQLFEVTDPGRALITGKCADIGKMKGVVLRRTGGARTLLPQRLLDRH